MGEKHDSWLHSVLGIFVSAGEAVVHGVEAVGHAVANVAEHIFEPEKAAKEDFAEAMKAFDAAVKRLKDAGLDDSHYVAQGKDLRSGYDDALKMADADARTTELKRLASASRDAAERADTDTKRATGSAVEGVSKAIGDMRESAAKLIKKLPDTNPKKGELTKVLADLDKAIADDVKVTDRAARAKQEKVTQATAEKLLDDAGEAGGDRSAVQAAYEKALEDRYGFKVNTKGGINTHNDQLYKMFDKVPDADVTQDRMKSFNYSNTDDDGNDNPSAYYQDAKIVARDYGDDDKLNYAGQDENAFSITTLHELGHSVDDRFGIMASHQKKPGAGGWNGETIDSVAAAYAGDFKKNAGKAVKADLAAVTDMCKTVLGGGVAEMPAGQSAADSAAIGNLLARCAGRTVGSDPWDTQDDVGGRCYHQSYDSEWNSYLTSSRSAGSVTNYQWRAPGEYFAELYAFTYFKSKEAPSGTDAGIAQYMYGGKAAAPPTP